MRTYYIAYDEQTNINYHYIFLLHKIAQVNNGNRLYNTIKYNSMKELAESMNNKYRDIVGDSNTCFVSISTLSRVINSDKEEKYFTHRDNTIILNNNFSNSKTNGKAKFITLTDKELNFLLLQKNKMLTKYYLFMKYNCGYSGINKADFTAEQFLQASMYSTKSNSTLSNISNYNRLLEENNFISISKFRFNGKERNCYSIL